MKRTFLTGLLFGLTVASLQAESFVSFNAPAYNLNTSWADGTFSTNLSGDYPDGFYSLSSTSAYNGYGQNNEYILFNAPQELNSLNLQGGHSEGCCGVDPATIVVSLFDSANNSLTSQTVTDPSTLTTLTFNTPNVSKIEFDFTGGTNVYGDGRQAAWYVASDIGYSPNTVPEPSYAFVFTGGLLAICLLRRKTARAE